MTLIEKLKTDKNLSNFICSDCSENNVSLEINKTIFPEEIIIIKVDDYYNKNIHNPPPSPDCLIIQFCKKSDTYNVYLVELKDIKGPDGFIIKNIVQKFVTCLDDFMNNVFSVYFNDSSINYNSIKLLFITDPYNFKTHPEKQSKMRGHKLDSLMSIRIPKFFNFHLYIEHKLPNPVINPC